MGNRNETAVSALPEKAINGEEDWKMRHLPFLLVAAALLTACGISPAPALTPTVTPDVEATKQAMFAGFAATMTAAAPTATATATWTATPTATPSPTDTPRPTPVLTDTATTVSTETPTPPPATATPTPLPPTDTAVPATAAIVLPSPTATETPLPAVASTPKELTVEFHDMLYQCEMGCMGQKNPVWSYRTFQVKMTIVNHSKDKTVDWDWKPARWFITDGTNVRVDTRMWEWVERGQVELYKKPPIPPGGGAEWTFVAAPIGQNEWVSAVEFEAWGQVYRQEFDLGPARNNYNYQAFCGLMPPDTSCGQH